MHIWKNTNGETSAEQPTRIRLPDRTTRSHEAITPELLELAGWSMIYVEDTPATEGNVAIDGTEIGTGP